MRVTVLVTLLNDPRVERTLESLVQQTRRPDDVLVADGGSRDDTLDRVRKYTDTHDWIRCEHHAGSVAETRNSALERLDADAVVFLDADQVAPEGWLAALAEPLEKGRAAFTGGPTRPLAPPTSDTEAYLNDFEAWFYPNVVAHDLTKLPMGNSAWSMRVFEKIGNFDERLTWGGEDYDVNVRAHRAGFHGEFVPDAWVYHDQSGLDSLKKLLRRKYRYNVGAATAYLKNGVLGEKSRSAAKNTAAFKHPYERFNWVIQPVALGHAVLKWKEMRRR